MAKLKYYAVRIGRIPGIYLTWSQTEEQVKGFSGADYKSFFTEEEAIAYLSGKDREENCNELNETEQINQKIELEISQLEEGEVIAFIDGSHSSDADGKEKFSFGALLITNESRDSLFKAFVGTPNMQSRNIAGEIEGAKQAILWAIDKHQHRIKIFYDYEGIEKWAKKAWRANSEIAKEYVKFFDEKSKLIKVEFEHVKSHSGIRYNEKADELAKQALLSQGYKTYNDGTVYFIGFEKEDWIRLVNLLNLEVNEEDSNKIIDLTESKPKRFMDKLELTLDSQRVIINCYRGKKSYVQGKQNVLFQSIISRAIETLPTDNAVIEVLKMYHALTIEEYEVENEFSAQLPNFPSNEKDIKLRNTLLSAVFNTLLTGYMPDYTCLVTPLLRAMEFYLHRILSDRLGKTTTTPKGKNIFSYFALDSTSNCYHYNSCKKNLSDEQISYLDELYNRYNKLRHPYSHWAENSLDTAVITDLKVAQDLIIEGLHFINRYYILF